MELKVIARIQSEFPTKFGIPHQSGRIDSLRARIIFEESYRVPEAFHGIEAFDYLWLIWGFSEAKREDWSPTVRPPRLGGNKRVGVFASRSPFRPNSLGLSSVRLLEMVQDPHDGPVLVVGGADLMDGTPIYDVKPYIALDAHTGVSCGFTDTIEDYRLKVQLPEKLAAMLPEAQRAALLDVLANDPRPRYQRDPDRIYGMPFCGMDVRFRVDQRELYVVEIVPLETRQSEGNTE